MFLMRSLTANKPKPDPELIVLLNLEVSNPFPLSNSVTVIVSLSFFIFNVIKEAFAYFIVFVTAS